MTVSADSVVMNEAGTATYEVSLAAPPVTDAVVTATVTGSGVSVSPMEMTFTPENWSTAQPITVTSIPDADAQDNVASVAHTLSAGGFGLVSAPVVLVTVSDPVGLPVLDAVRAGDAAFLAEWSPVPVSDGVTVTGYRIRYRWTTSVHSPWSTVEVDASAISRLVRLPSDINNISYEVELRAITDAGHSPWSDAVRVTIGELEMPTSLWVGGSTGSLTISWEPPLNEELLTGAGKRIRYFVRVNRVRQDVERGWYTYDTRMQRGNKSGGVRLKDGTEYVVTVRSALFTADGTLVVNGEKAEARGTPQRVRLEENDFRHDLVRDISEHVVSRLESANPTYTGWLRQAQDYVASQGDSPDNDEDLHWSYYGFHVEDDDFYGAVSPICTGREIEDNITELPRCKVPGVAVDLDHLCSNVADHQEFYSCFTGGTAVTLDPHALSTNEQLQNTLVH